MKSLILSFFLFACWYGHAQSDLFNQNITYSRADSLRGSITEGRAWWNLKHYELGIEVDIANKSLKGSNTITYEVLESNNFMQIDLQAPMKILKVSQNGMELLVEKEGNAHFVQLKEKQKVGTIQKLEIEFVGKPREAVNAPWDGGFTWAKDSNGKDFIANANQGIGASIWWPCKDHGYDEPEDGLRMNITVPDGLVAVGNGRLIGTNKQADKTTYTWEVSNPINNYGVNINIGDYINYSETYEGEKGKLDIGYWVLRENVEKAKAQFKQVPMTLDAFEYWFGPYPFYEDSYKLVEVPYLGMEHQSSVTYGNSYKNGYNGRGRGSFDWSGTGWGLKWDYIIVHETGHEWFANNITARDVADLWIHEGFTCYSETLYLDYHFGEQAASEYVIGTRRVISNESPLIGHYDVNKEGSGDMYFKGNNILHTLRQIVNDDEKWRSILRGLNERFYHQTVTTAEVENYIAEQSKFDLSSFFDQYLRNSNIPSFEYKIDNENISFRWTNVIDGFSMPLDVIIDGEAVRIDPSIEWSSRKGQKIQVDQDFYINSVDVSEND
ncbi:MAG: M1 family metallopeptidase [Ekhidna sp.]|uniref:M1 family metallopeptidase n=1 Tax=Ekhidna sp. TaxID=2608089 RepID=UPI0032EFDE44